MSETEKRITDAMGAFTREIEPGLATSWTAIDARLDDSASTSAAGHRGFLVAAAIVLVAIMLTVGAVVGRRSESSVGVATTPSPSSPSVSIVALTSDRRIVELDATGHELRTITSFPRVTDAVRGPIAVSPVDRTIYVEISSAGQCPGPSAAADDVVGNIVAIPFAGGGPSVVASGRSPAISPDGANLAFIGRKDGSHCGSTADWTVDVLEVGSSPHTRVDLPAVGVAQAPLQRAEQLDWVDADTLVVRGRWNDPPVRAVAFGVVSRSSSTGSFAPDPARGSGVDVGDDRVVAATDDFALDSGVRGDGWSARIATIGTTFAAGTVWVSVVRSPNALNRELFRVDPATYNSSRPFSAVTLDVSPDSAQILVVASGESGDATSSHLFLWDGQVVHKLADGIVAATWAESSDIPAPGGTSLGTEVPAPPKVHSPAPAASTTVPVAPTTTTSGSVPPTSATPGTTIDTTQPCRERVRNATGDNVTVTTDPAMPAAVSDTAESLLAAAQRCDWDALRSLMAATFDAGSTDGGSDPNAAIAGWRGSSDGGALALVNLLGALHTTPHADANGAWTWNERSPAEIGGYPVRLLTIAVDGRWTRFIEPVG